MELQGTVKRITELQTFTSGFQKRELVILTQEQYPQPINKANFHCVYSLHDLLSHKFPHHAINAKLSLI